MKTIILNKPGELHLIERAELEAAADEEAIVKIKRVGICGTDYHAFSGNQPYFSYPRVLGHELGAEVIALGGSQAIATLKIGDRVSVEPYLNCNDCQACRGGHFNCCERIQVLGVHTDGGMTEFLKVPIRKLHKSEVLSFDQLALVETLGIGLHAVNRAGIRPEDSVLVIGAGPIGLSVAQFSKLSGATVGVADMTAGRLEFIRRHGISDRSIVVKEPLTPEYIREFFGGDLPSVIIDATGNRGSMLNAFNLIAHGGKVVFVGLFQGEVEFNDPNFHRREVTLLASRNSLPDDFRKIISLMETGQIDTAPWLSHRTDFEHLSTDFATFMEPDQELIKAIIEV
ncbi:zinc-binding alcohol dehydrogenase family protein [Persicitalea jodogahamensis]|uniref:Zinc-type alcohol dehydrogenase n=1 Tax=Persicitalea jodogahamensis TaxID=402147 RepID=A0A8J3D959_9BACT|nr:zinc-binding alcohol dehydrogenase family protein [Persicitalea jodogahamensis]GHB63593.1 zinc-type alcohol dehydrogenase [Persicitalea jodogahamensis]